MRILLTGSLGRVGSSARLTLRDAGFDVVDFDLLLGHDVLDAAQLEQAARGCDAVVHAAAVLEPSPSDPERLRSVNVGGTARVLEAVRAASIPRVLFVSSAAATGVF